MKKIVKKQTYPNLITDIAELIEQGRKVAVQYINTVLVATYWLVGRRIVEFEQKGEERAEYGKKLLKNISLDLTKRFGKGWGEPHLRAVRQFYLIYGDLEKRYTLCNKSGKPNETNIRYTPCSELVPVVKSINTQASLIASFSKMFPLSWSHYRLLMRINEPLQREFYEVECIRGSWSVRQLDRQIQSMLYERTALSRLPEKTIEKQLKELKEKDKMTPELIFRDPYVVIPAKAGIYELL